MKNTLFLLLVLGLASSASAQWPNGYLYSASITIAHTKVPNTDQVSFPVLVSGTYAELANTGSGGRVVSPNGYDVIFTSDAAGSNKLNFERELYSSATGQVAFWVQVPVLSHVTDTVFYVFYGNPAVTTDQASPSATWGNSFTGVWHLAGNPAGAAPQESDSSANGNSLTAVGPWVTGGVAGGKIGNALNSTTNNNGFTSSSPSLTPTTSMTVSSWVRTSITNGIPAIMAQYDFTGSPAGYYFIVQGNSGRLRFKIAAARNGGTNQTTFDALSGNITDGNWHHVAATYSSGANPKLYVDGSSVAAPPTNGMLGQFQGSLSNTVPFLLAPFDGSLEPFHFEGNIDEARLSNSVRSADWIATEYQNQVNPDSFYSVSWALVSPNTPQLTAAPSPLSFLGPLGGANPQSQALTISNGGAGTLNWTATASQPWITFSSTGPGDVAGAGSLSGSGNQTIWIQPVGAGLAPGPHPATITITDAGAAFSPLKIDVSFFVPWPNGYNSIGTITVPAAQVANTDQTNFPVLVTGTYPELAAAAGKVKNVNGYDIIFTSDANGNNRLPYERESYSSATGQVAFWVQVPLLSHTTENTFYVFYGNPAVSTDQSNKAAVWDSSYVGVWHLGENGSSPAVADSSTNGNTGTAAANTNTKTAAGVLGRALTFNGSTDRILTTVTSGKTFTWEAWVNSGAISGSTQSLITLAGSSYMLMDVQGGAANLWSSDALVGANLGVTGLTNNTWNHLVLTRKGDNAAGGYTAYLNGVQRGQQTSGVWSSSSTLAFGTRLDLAGQNFAGMLDEIRVSNSARTADSILTEYRNQSNPAAFYSIVWGPSVPSGGGGGGGGGTPGVSATPLSLTYTVTAGAPNAAAQSVDISNSGNGTLSWTATADPASLLAVTAVNGTPGSLSVSGTGAQTIWVQAASSSLSAGTYVGTVTISAPGAVPFSQTVNVTVTVNPPSGSAWPNNYSYRGTITVPAAQVANTDQTNFPVLVTGTYPELAAAAGKVKNVNGYDIIFTSDANGNNRLPYERESYSPATGQVAFWVQVPLLSHTTENTFYVFYGNPAVSTDQSNKAAVWDSSYVGVWHLGENGSSPAVADSSTNGNTGTAAANTNTKTAAGVLGRALTFNGSTDRILTTVTSGKTFTWEAWVNSGAISGSTQSLITLAGSSYMLMDVQGGAANLWSSDALVGANLGVTGLTNNTWNHLVLTRKGDNAAGGYTAYLNGVQRGQQTSGVWSSSSTLAFGTRLDLAGQNFAGMLDEIRVSNSARTADSILTEYRNMSNPAGFYSVVWGQTSGGGGGTPGVSATPLSLTYTVTAGAPNAAAQSVDISNSGNGTLSWTATADPASLLAVTAVNGTPGSLSVSGTGAQTIWVQAASSSLSAGTYVGTVTISAPGAVPFSQTVNVTVTVNPPSGSAWPNNYSYRGTITVPAAQVANTDQTNFPVLVTGTYPELAAAAGKVKNVNGYDIIFTSDANGNNRLPYERESYSTATGQAAFWVQVPTLSHTTNTVFYVFYGNAAVSTDQSNKTAVWDSGYVGVWHLGENAGNATVGDSSANGNTSTAAANTNTRSTTGMVGQGLGFNGSTDRILTATSNGKAFTWEAWVNSGTLTGGVPQSVITLAGSSYMLMDVQGGAAYLWSSDALVGANLGVTGLTNNTWNHLVLTRKGDNTAGGYTAYLNGVQKGQQTSGVWTSGASLTFGSRLDVAGQNFTGVLDEIRVSNSARTADSILTEYRNMSNPAGFYSVVWGQTSGGGGGTPGVSATPLSLTYTVTAGAPNAAAQSVDISNSGNGTLSWTATADPASLLAVTAVNGTPGSLSVSGTGAQTIWVQAASSSLSAGTYVGTVTISAPGAVPFSQTVNVTVTVNPPSGSAWPNNYSYRGTITVPAAQVANTDQTNFPVLVTGTYPELAAAAGKVKNVNGYDIIFTSDANGNNRLPYERESYSTATGQAAFWVQVPTLSHTTNTVFYVFYGNAAVSTDQSNKTAVWDSGYVGVWHLGENAGNATVGDSSANGNTSTAAANTNTRSTTGMVGQGLGFNGSTDRILTTVTSGKTFTWEAWVNSGTVTGGTFQSVITLAGSSYMLMDVVGGAASLWSSDTLGGVNLGVTGLVNNAWNHIVLTRKGDSTAGGYTAYLNGVQKGQQTSGVWSSGSTLTFGSRLDVAGQSFTGVLDEIRVSNTARTADWVATEYRNHSSPAAFCIATWGQTP